MDLICLNNGLHVSACFDTIEIWAVCIIIIYRMIKGGGQVMLADQRKQIILDQVNLNHSVTVARLVELLSVSTETVRRDLEDLENNNLLTRVHGGAVSVKKRYQFDDMNVRTTSNMELKKQIARKALEYVNDGDTIAIDSGSTASVFAMALKARAFDSLSIITYSSEVFSILSGCENYRITLLGGDYLPKERIFYGFLTHEAMKKLYFSKAFVVPSALSLEDGAHDFIRETYENQCMLVEHSSETFILADSSKFETKGDMKICDLLPEYTVITDDQLPESILDMYRGHKLNVVMAQ